MNRKDLMITKLEKLIITDGNNGDTTVLASLLEMLDETVIFNALSDGLQTEFRFYYEIHVTGKNGFSTSVISDIELDEDDVILLGYEQDKLEGDDCHFVDYVNELDFDEWNTHFNFN